MNSSRCIRFFCDFFFNFFDFLKLFSAVNLSDVYICHFLCKPLFTGLPQSSASAIPDREYDAIAQIIARKKKIEDIDDIVLREAIKVVIFLCYIFSDRWWTGCIIRLVGNHSVWTEFSYFQMGDRISLAVRVPFCEDENCGSNTVIKSQGD